MLFVHFKSRIFSCEKMVDLPLVVISSLLIRRGPDYTVALQQRTEALEAELLILLSKKIEFQVNVT